MNDSEQRTKTQALAVYLYWLRTGQSQVHVARIFEIHRYQVRKYCKQVRKALHKNFVSDYVGVKQLQRANWIECNTDVVNTLFDAKVCIAFND